ncbi:IclR family transcriptional regulator [Frigoribacterium sp. PhB24]|uniref:IclR family transcriptional regulator n=1 Tax=Frigoribacterium sp. PhB24 TaxID=2485204 RepID=UPI000F4A37A1|nr:IclR family transcriptional regulator [Frigoribacterium sp. PhB24]ROS54115.1 IclR family transcriptional regulator [Frigoribacterium sp. PhB24]
MTPADATPSPAALSPATPGRGDTSGVRAVSRALAVLQAFTPDRSTQTLAELVRVSGLPRTTVLRLVDTLVAEGMLQHGPDGRVGVGTRMIHWGAFAARAWAVPTATADRMAALAEETGETVSLYVRRGVARVVVAQSPSPHSLRHVVQVGDELPLWIGAAGAVLLSGEPADVLDATLDDVDATAHPGTAVSSPTTPFSAAPTLPVDRDAVRARIERARLDGWSVSHGTREPGNSGVAVLVPGRPPGRPVALALGGPTSRFTDDAVARFADELRRASSDLARTGLPPALD